MEQALSIEVDFSLPTDRSTHCLKQIFEWHGKPNTIRVDNGTEYVSPKLMEWPEKRRITIRHFQTGKPQQNAYIERYNETLLHEWLNQHIIDSI